MHQQQHYEPHQTHLAHETDVNGVYATSVITSDSYGNMMEPMEMYDHHQQHHGHHHQQHHHANNLQEQHHHQPHHHHQQHPHHHHHHHQQQQQPVSPYSQQHNASSYASGQPNGYGVPASQLVAPMSHHRLGHADSSALHQHFIGQHQPAPGAAAPGAATPTAATTAISHHHSNAHAQHHIQQHYHQPLTQVQSPHAYPHHHHHHHHHHPAHPNEPSGEHQHHFYNQQASAAYYQPHHFGQTMGPTSQQQLHGQVGSVRAPLGSQQHQASNLSSQAKDVTSAAHNNQMVAKNYSPSLTHKTTRNHHLQGNANPAISPVEQHIVRTSSVASSLSSSSPKQAPIQQQSQAISNHQAISNFQHSGTPTPGALVHHQQQHQQQQQQQQKTASGVVGQYCRRQSVSVISTASSAASSGSGGEHQTNSPLGAEMSPGLLKQEQGETTRCVAIQNSEQMEQTLKKESQLDQLHQQCASLLDDQQRVHNLVSTCANQRLISNSGQQLESKLGPNEPNSGTQTPISANNNNNNNNSNNNNSNLSGNNNLNSNNGNATNGRSKRLRTSFKHHQLKEMKKWFSKNQNPDAKDLKTLAQTTGLSKRVLQVWFQNARAKFRRNNAKAVNQQLYNVNQHTSHMLQFQQQAPHHPIHTYGQQHHLNQHTLIGHHHHSQHHHLQAQQQQQQQQQQQTHLHGPAVSSAASITSQIGMPATVHSALVDSSDHNTANQQTSQAQPHDGNQLVSNTSDGPISSFARLDIE